jgi:lysophospholipid acyltransferase
MVNNWNIGTSKWLRNYCYARTEENLAFTQITSSVWHGLNPGYFMMFGTSVFFVDAGRVVFNWGKKIPASLQVPWKAFMWFFWQFQLNYMAMPFIIVALEKSLYVWGSVYYIPHVLLAIIIIFGKLFPTKKEKKGEAAAAPAKKTE